MVIVLQSRQPVDGVIISSRLNARNLFTFTPCKLDHALVIVCLPQLLAQPPTLSGTGEDYIACKLCG